MTKSKQYFEKALELKHAATSEYKALADKARAEISAVRSDLDLSAQGRQKRAVELMHQHGLKIMQFAYVHRQKVHAALKRAKAAAHAEMKAGAGKVSEEQRENFERAYNRTKTQLMLATRADKAKEVLNDLLTRVTEPALRSELADRFGELAENILTATGNDQQMRGQLAKVYDDLQESALSPEQSDARDVLENVEYLENSNVFGEAVHNNLNQLCGWQYASYINRPGEFFDTWVEYKNDKPADYLDEEEIERLNRIDRNLNDPLSRYSITKRADDILNRMKMSEEEKEAHDRKQAIESDPRVVDAMRKVRESYSSTESLAEYVRVKREVEAELDER